MFYKSSSDNNKPSQQSSVLQEQQRQQQAAAQSQFVFHLPPSTQDEDTLSTYTFHRRSVFQGQDCLFLDATNYSFWINKDKTGFYVSAMADGMTPQAK